MDRIQVLRDYAKVLLPDNRVIWTAKDYPADGNHGRLKQAIESKSVILFDDNQFLWLQNPEILRAFKRITVLTFQFESSYFKKYLDINGMPYTTSHVQDGKLVPGRQDLTEHLNRLRPLIHIYEGKLNDIGETFPLSFTFWKRRSTAANRELIALRTYSYLYNHCHSSSKLALWTAPKLGLGKEFKVRDYASSFMPCNMCASNDYRNATNLAYLINPHNDPDVQRWFRKNGATCYDDEFALSMMLQWIWRSAIREGKDINIYIPSPRMRRLLQEWLQNGFIVPTR